MLEQLCDCLCDGPEEFYGWAFDHESPPLAAFLARFHYAMRLLLNLVFPNGPLPDGASPSDLSEQQYAAAHAGLRSGLIGVGSTARQLRQCRLPGDEATLRTRCPTSPSTIWSR